MKPHLKPHISSTVIFFTEKRAAHAEVDKNAARNSFTAISSEFHSKYLFMTNHVFGFHKHFLIGGRP